MPAAGDEAEQPASPSPPHSPWVLSARAGGSRGWGQGLQNRQLCSWLVPDSRAMLGVTVEEGPSWASEPLWRKPAASAPHTLCCLGADGQVVTHRGAAGPVLATPLRSSLSSTYLRAAALTRAPAGSGPGLQHPRHTPHTFAKSPLRGRTPL